MWRDFSKHHAQQGAVTAVVWGSPRCDAAGGAGSSGRAADASPAEADAAAAAAATCAGVRSCTGACKVWKIIGSSADVRQLLLSVGVCYSVG